MKRQWIHLKHALTCDDLFLRVLFLFFGVGAIGFSLALSYWILSTATKADSWSLLIFVGGLAILLILWGALLLGRCLSAPSSRWSKFAEKAHPDTVDGEGLIILLLLSLLPAVILTLVLRRLGMRGYVS
jgi:hypothetical protein